MILHKLKIYADAVLDRQIEELCTWARRPTFNPPVYADNAAATAAGMVAGQTYRTATGVLMVVY